MKKAFLYFFATSYLIFMIFLRKFEKSSQMHKNWQKQIKKRLNCLNCLFFKPLGLIRNPAVFGYYTWPVTNCCAQNRAALPLPIWSKLYVVLANLRAKITKTASKVDDRIYPLLVFFSKKCTVFWKFHNSACSVIYLFFVNGIVKLKN